MSLQTTVHSPSTYLTLSATVVLAIDLARGSVALAPMGSMSTFQAFPFVGCDGTGESRRSGQEREDGCGELHDEISGRKTGVDKDD